MNDGYPANLAFKRQRLRSRITAGVRDNDVAGTEHRVVNMPFSQLCLPGVSALCQDHSLRKKSPPIAMSIYRTLDRYPRDDIHVYQRVRSELPPGLGTPQINVKSDQYQHLRKPTPVNRPLLRTLMWVADLPEDLRPTALLRDYARIANLIAAAWGDRSCFYAYIDSLLTDNRGNRRGFPPDVLRELEALRRCYDVKDQDSPWDTVTKRG